MNSKNTVPGVHPYLKLAHFSEAEKHIINKLSKEWYITNGGATVKLGKTSNYGYFLMKPTATYQRMFNLTREVIVVFSSYPDFEPRTLDIFDHVFKKYQTLRLENICTILISMDKNVGVKLGNLLKADPESRIVVPFSYNEILTNRDPYFFQTRFRNKFYTRDLFSFQAPIKNEFFFFGRNDLVHKIVNRHRSNENSGLFGLRKTGKTSVIFGINRTLKRLKETSVFIDCQNPAFHKKRWNNALHYIIKELKEQNNLTVKTSPKEDFTEEQASEKFEQDIINLFESKQNNKRSFLIIFDEIENMTMGISPSSHWTKEQDFILFWQTIRSLFQKFLISKKKNIFTFLIVGTNPRSIEVSTIHNSDNPIFNKIPYQYIKGFDVPHTKEMVGILGGYMGLIFDEIIYSKLTEDFGGHPFLIRQVCSIINKNCEGDRPIRIDKSMYKEGKELFLSQNSSYIDMILSVLKEFYPEEYEMLTYLSINDMDAFNNIANEFPELISHLLGYKIIDKNNNNYNFSIEAVKLHLSKKHKFKKKFLSTEEKWSEISERRNKLETNLRTLVRRQLQAFNGKSEAKNIVLSIMGNPRKTKYNGYSYNELFENPNVHIYLMDVIKILRKNYNSFKNILGDNVDDIIRKLEAINERRSDAHAKPISEEDMNYFRVCISNIESKLKDFL